MFIVREMRFFKCFAILSVFVFAVSAEISLFANESNATRALPATCVPEGRENLGWWKNMNDSFNAIARERNAKIVFLGDSITDLWRRVPSARGGKSVWDARIAPLDAVNFGISGDRTENILWRLDSGNLSGKMNPKLVVLMIGTNNWRNSPEDTAQGIKAILTKIHGQHPQTKILLLAVFPRGADKTDAKRQTNEKVNGIIKGFADGRRVYWLDINKVFLEKDSEETLPRSVMPDLLHPNEEGYRRWAEAVVPVIKRLVR